MVAALYFPYLNLRFPPYLHFQVVGGTSGLDTTITCTWACIIRGGRLDKMGVIIWGQEKWI